LRYDYYPEGDTQKKPGTIVIDLVKGTVVLEETAFADADGQYGLQALADIKERYSTAVAPDSGSVY
jgi:hypothetical protein